MNVLDLFSGIGGFSLGLEAAGMRTVAFCEIETYCQKILRQHWPNVPIHDDVRKLDGFAYRRTVELICGGYPCQPFSMAGRRRGAEDERHLWPQMYRLIREIRPRWVVAENVAGHISLGFDEVATSLEAEGFAIWPFIVPACAIGAPHRRDRIWIVAHAPRKQAIGKEREWFFPHSAGNIAPNALNERGEGRVCQALQGQSIFARKLTRGFKRWSDGWPVSAPRLCGVDDGIPNRTQRLRALGNAVVPQIPYLIGKAILRYEREMS